MKLSRKIVYWRILRDQRTVLLKQERFRRIYFVIVNFVYN